jgi:N-acetyl-gamma-glutamyl-phosphate reductase
VQLVDLSADFRLGDAALHERIYGAPHDAPARLPGFTCALPDLEHVTPPGPIAHPGCFTTAVTLAIAPLVALDLAEPSFFASAVTGSTGSGRTPSPATHHPDRHANFRAYNPLAHRHAPEMEMLAARAASSADAVRVLFTPHSGPFARGIHATVHARLLHEVDAERLAAAMAGFYAHTPFVHVTASPPALSEVVGTNRARLGVAVRDRDAVVFSAIDNLTKGASGGALQWMNRLCGLDETAGLLLPGLGWS